MRSHSPGNQNRPKFRVSVLAVAVAATLAGCELGGTDDVGSSSGTGSDSARSIGGGGVKGPLADAVVKVYQVDYSAAGFKGSLLATGSTDAAAAIQGLSLPIPLNPPYVMEFTSDANTTDITTGAAPVISTMRTVITQALLDSGEQIYATPLTTMATDLAIKNADSAAPYSGNGDGAVTQAEFLAALPVAASQVTSTLGFGVDSSIDIFDTPPLINDTTDSAEEQRATATYRTAVEALTAVVYEMEQHSTGDSNAVLSELANDLADGAIDGSVDGNPSSVIGNSAL
ncbi:hypothetical protein Ga0076813_14494, partial [endosymbiont of Ridgeia piscesae]